MNYVIGAGGVGSWLIPSLCLLTKPKQLTVVDGDSLEEKNMNRQLFEHRWVGRNKAYALAQKYGCESIGEYYAMGRFVVQPEDWLIVCADNHPARRAALNEADVRGCRVIVAANETHSAEAYYYTRAWRGSPIDPRVYYPELLTGNDDDPLGEAIGCTGEAQSRNPQLVTSNMMAASLAMHLYVLWSMEAEKLETETINSLPHKLVSNLTRLESVRIKDTQSQANERTAA
jgi:hypothetical protein